jgi:hypothetical protein
MVYTVWLFTRPLSFFPSFGVASDGMPALRHWGVLVSELTVLDAKVIIQRTRVDADTPLGTMYELFPQEGYNNVNIIRPFGIATIRKEWHAFSVEYIDTTEMSFEMIDVEGTAHVVTIICLKRITLKLSGPYRGRTSHISAFREQLPEFRQISSRSAVSWSAASRHYT